MCIFLPAMRNAENDIPSCYTIRTFALHEVAWISSKESSHSQSIAVSQPSKAGAGAIAAHCDVEHAQVAERDVRRRAHSEGHH
eukprot:5713585-Pleurochrysis_carterae.AAC.4